MAGVKILSKGGGWEGVDTDRGAREGGTDRSGGRAAAGMCQTEQQGEPLRGGALRWPVRRVQKTGVYRKRPGNARKLHRLAKLYFLNGNTRNQEKGKHSKKLRRKESE